MASKSQFKREFAKLMDSTEIPFSLPDSEVVKRYSEIFSFVEAHTPPKLFRFRRCDLDSILAFEQGRISLCSANQFSDKHDSTIYYDYHSIEEQVISWKQTVLPQFLQYIKSIPLPSQSDQFTPTANKLIQMLEAKESDKEIFGFVSNEINTHLPEWKELAQQAVLWPRTLSPTRIACFTENVKSKFMWDTYAQGYSGFALEYDFTHWRSLTINNNPVVLMPVIYRLQKLDATEMVNRIVGPIFMRSKGAPEPLIQAYSNAYPINHLHYQKVFLYKDKAEYAHEKEWRMLEMLLSQSEEAKDVVTSIPDAGCLKAVYYGPDMEKRYKTHLREIARQKGVKEYDVSIDNNSRQYGLKITRI